MSEQYPSVLEVNPRTGEFEPGAWLAADPRDQYAIRGDVEDAFSILERLSPRLRRIAMLRALGLMHREISEITGDCPVRVAQLNARANFEIYEVLAERAHETEHVSPRAARLWELERDQPTWLTDRIGRGPRSCRRSVGQTEQRHAWRRTALALDDYRTAVGSDRFDDAIDSCRRSPAAPASRSCSSRRRSARACPRPLDRAQRARRLTPGASHRDATPGLRPPQGSPIAEESAPLRDGLWPQ